MKKILTLRVPVWLTILAIVVTLGFIGMKAGALITDYWDIGPWRVDSSGHLLPNADSTRNIGSSSYAINRADIDALVLGYKAITTTTTVTADDGGFLNVTGSTCAINLPTAVGNAGLWYSVKHSTTNTIVVTIDPNGTETIDGAATNTNMDAANDTLGFYSDGVNWKIFMRYIQ